MTVNITCCDCDGLHLCEACKAAGKALASAGVRVEHSTRYAALRAAASGSYGFDACILPLSHDERAVADAAIDLFGGKKIAFVVDDDAPVTNGIPSGIARLKRTDYEAGTFDVGWLKTDSLVLVPADELPASIAIEPPAIERGDDRAHATRRLKRLADAARVSVARAGLESTPQLDLLAALEDEVAWAAASGTSFAIVLVHLPGIAASVRGEKDDAGERLASAAAVITRTVRAIDVIAGRNEDFLVVLAETDIAGARLARTRIAAALASSAVRSRVKPRQKRGFAAWSAGCAAYPADGATRDALLARATATLQPIIQRTK